MSERADVLQAPIRVLLADDEPLMRQSLRIVIDSQPDMDVVGEASTGDESVRAVRKLNPDVVLMDIRMPGSDGIHATQTITNEPSLRHVRVLVLSMYELDEYVYGALRARASGFLLKDAHPTVLLDAIRRIHRGEALFAPSILSKLVDHYIANPTDQVPVESDRAGCRLTPRETEVLTLIGRGLSNSEIVAMLYISPNTLKTHISNLLLKLQARDRAQLVIAAYQRGLVKPTRP
ncbi:response regulator transcription factor [Stomatohabitans albus]|uniref:response regulator transcription factor n=2 Tax=Stomatohabitans albus TaxID=3110766 RepID=UPI00300DACA7